MNVRRFVGVALLMVAAIPAAALARDCNEVKAEIDAKIKAKGVTNFALQIVNGPDVKEGQIVGNCDVGAKRIVYFKQPNGKNALEARSTSPTQAEPPSSPPATPKQAEPVSTQPATPTGTEANR
jgi:Protein of unknown function (DUF1161)